MNLKKGGSSYLILGLLILFLLMLAIYLVGYAKILRVKYSIEKAPLVSETKQGKAVPLPPVPVLDKAAYDQKMLELANNPVPPAPSVTTTTATTGASVTATTTPPPAPKPTLWPAKTVYPNVGAILPFSRIVAYYGNFYSTKMGVLGEYPKDIMLEKLKAAMQEWETADPNTPVVPAIDYIAITAQASAGFDGKYRARMPDSQIDQAISIAKEINGIVILDIQVGLSNVQTEVPLLEKYLKMPQVHLALDPEFSMKDGVKPGREIGTMDATDINFTANYLANLVKENNLPPKILVIHRFTEDMVTNYKQITPLPEVQMVMDMDGWGFAAKKVNTYKVVITKEPVQFTGFKLFYKNDLLPPSTRMLTPQEVLNLQPIPSFIQYQ